MGKSPKKKRLNILVDPEWEQHPKVLELKEQGHGVEVLVSGYAWPDARQDGVTSPDLVLSKSAHMWADDMWHLLPITLKAARARLPKGGSVEE